MKDATNRFSIRRTLLPFAAIGVAIPLLLMASVLLRGGRNLHSSMQYWSGLNFLIQSNDPTYASIEDPKADIREIAALLWPRDGSDERAAAIYASWRQQKDWAMFDYSLTRLDQNEADDRAVAIHELHARYVPQNPDPLAKARERTERQESVWVKHNGRWYLLEQTRVVEKVVEKPILGVITP